VLIVVYGLAVFYAVEFVRTLPFVDVWVAAGRKPFACHVCMSGWGSIALHGLLYGLGDAGQWWITGPAAAGVALLLLYGSDALAGAGQQPPLME